MSAYRTNARKPKRSDKKKFPPPPIKSAKAPVISNAPTAVLVIPPSFPDTALEAVIKQLRQYKTQDHPWLTDLRWHHNRANDSVWITALAGREHASRELPLTLFDAYRCNEQELVNRLVAAVDGAIRELEMREQARLP